MKAIWENGQIVGYELTRRNLEALLAKLDQPDGVSQRTLTKLAVDSDDGRVIDFFVRAVPNEEHYEAEGRPAGMMYPREEAKISKPSTGVGPCVGGFLV